MVENPELPVKSRIRGQVQGFGGGFGRRVSCWAGGEGPGQEDQEDQEDQFFFWVMLIFVWLTG